MIKSVPRAADQQPPARGGTYAIDDVLPVVDPSAYVHPTAVIIGDVHVGPDCYVGPHASLRGDLGRIRVGAGSSIQDSCVLHVFPGRELVVGAGCLLGHQGVLHGCTLEPGAFVGMATVVMDGAVVGAGALVGAHSFVPTDTVFAPRMLAVGNPARELRPLTEDELTWTANGVRTYQALARRSLATLRPVTPLPQPPAEPQRLSVDPAVSVPLREHRRAGR
jgi:phenylacetic acid degradation protein